MRTLDFLRHRVAFSGVPFGEMEAALGRIGEGEAWEAAFEAAARGLRQLAEARQVAGCEASAAQAWLWTAAAFQAASIGMHLDPDRDGWPGRVTRPARVYAAGPARSCNERPSAARACRTAPRSRIRSCERRS